MIERMIYGWNLRRGLYLAMGIIFVAFFIQEKQYLGAIAGVLFTSMAIFNYGCAAGNCSTGISRRKNSSPTDIAFETEYEEIK